MRCIAAIAAICGAYLGLLACSPKPPDVSGTWVAYQTSPMGEMEFVARLKQDEQGKLTGSIATPFSEAPIQSGSIDRDNNIELTVQNESFGNIENRPVTAKLVGDELHLDLSKIMSGGPPGPPGAGAAGAGAPPAGGPPGAGPPGGGPPGAGPPGMPPLNLNLSELVAKRGEPKPSYKAPSLDYKTLAKVELPALKELPSNNLAKTPPMGWNSWNKFRTDISDKTVREIADALVASGMRDAGYLYINIDDGWQGKRDANGVLQPNPHFPDMKALADYVHSKGLKLGIYSSPGPRTCGGYEGSYGYEELDAKTWAEWGIDYLKYDWCSASRIWTNADMRAAYQKMGEALQKTGREIVYSLCQYGLAEVESWGRLVGGNLWRTTGDIFDNWNSMMGNVNSQEPRADKAGIGAWNDPDMLEVGNGGMSPAEYRTHFSLWAIVASPLIAGNDLRSMDDDTRAILMNKEVIAIDQDPLGKQGRRVAKQGDVAVWLRQLQGNAYALALVNEGAAEAEAKVTWADLKLPKNLQARDLWEKKDLGKLADGYSARIPSHGVVMLKLQQ